MALSSVLERHAEEAAGLWPRRERTAVAPHMTLADLTHLDRRIEAHLDGLRLAGMRGTRAASALDLNDAGAAFARTAQALDTKDAGAFAAVLDVLGEHPELVDGVIGALAWLPLPRTDWAVRAMLHASAPPALHRFGLTAHLAHRSDPGMVLVDALVASSAPLRATALEGAGLLGRADLLDDLLPSLDSPDAACRRAATLSASLLGDPGAPAKLWEHATSDTVEGRSALVVAVAKTPSRDVHDRLDAWMADPARARDAVVASGILGDASRIPALIGAMHEPALARVAGEALSRITGISIEKSLCGPPPEAFRSGPSDDPNDEDVRPDPDEGLAWPAPAAAGEVFASVEKNVARAVRLLFGQPLAAVLGAGLSRGSQRLRCDLALERAMLGSAPSAVAAVRAPGWVQVSRVT